MITCSIKTVQKKAFFARRTCGVEEVVRGAGANGGRRLSVLVRGEVMLRATEKRLRFVCGGSVRYVCPEPVLVKSFGFLVFKIKWRNKMAQ